MNKRIIIVSVYDGENTQAYPLGGVFETHEQAEQYIKNHVTEVKSNHWCSECVNGKDYYKENYSFGGSFHAQDSSDGASLDIEIYSIPDMTGKFPVCFVSKEDMEDAGYDVNNITDDDLEKIASRMKKYYQIGCCNCFSEDLKTAADYIGLKEKED